MATQKEIEEDRKRNRQATADTPPDALAIALKNVTPDTLANAATQFLPQGVQDALLPARQAADTAVGTANEFLTPITNLLTNPQTVSPQAVGQRLGSNVRTGGAVAGQALVGGARPLVEGAAGFLEGLFPGSQTASTAPQPEVSPEQEAQQVTALDVLNALNVPVRTDQSGGGGGVAAARFSGVGAVPPVAASGDALRQQALRAIQSGGATEVIRGTNRSYKIPGITGTGPDGEVTLQNLLPGAFEGVERLARAGGSESLAVQQERTNQIQQQIGAQLSLASRASGAQQGGFDPLQLLPVVLNPNPEISQKGKEVLDAYRSIVSASKGKGETDPLMQQLDAIALELNNPNNTEVERANLQESFSYLIGLLGQRNLVR